MTWIQALGQYRGKLLITFLNNLAFGLFAVRQIIIGATLLDLQIIIQESFAITSRLLIGHSVGYFSGGLLVGLIEDYCNSLLVLSLSTTLSGVFIIIVPLMYDFTHIIALIGLTGIAHAFFDMTCHKSILDHWGEKSGNFIQMLHMSFGVGALLAPLLVRPFLLPLPDQLDADWDLYLSYYHPEDVQIKWPYAIVGILSICTGLGFAYCYLEDKNKNNISINIVDTDLSSENHCRFSALKMYSAVLWVALMASLSFAIEVILCCYSQAFGVKSGLKMDKNSAALVSTVFWSVSTVAKLLFVALSLVVNERTIVYGCLGLFLAGIVLNTLLAPIVEYCLWAAAVLLGLGFSPLFAVAFATPAKYFQLTGTQTSVILLVGILGESLHTPIVGAFIDKNPSVYVYYLGVLCGLFFLLSLGLPYLCDRLFGQETRKFIIKRHASRFGSIAQPSLSRRNTTFSVASSTNG